MVCDIGPLLNLLHSSQAKYLNKEVRFKVNKGSNGNDFIKTSNVYHETLIIMHNEWGEWFEPSVPHWYLLFGGGTVYKSCQISEWAANHLFY